MHKVAKLITFIDDLPGDKLEPPLSHAVKLHQIRLQKKMPNILGACEKRMAAENLKDRQIYREFVGKCHREIAQFEEKNDCLADLVKLKAKKKKEMEQLRLSLVISEQELKVKLARSMDAAMDKMINDEALDNLEILAKNKYGPRPWK